MAVVAKNPTDRPEAAGYVAEPGYRGFLAFCESVGFPIEPFQRRIAKVFFGEARQIAIVLARGNFKTTTAALLGLHHLVSVPGARVVIGAMAKDQARVCYERMRGFAQHPSLEDEVTIRHLELRHEEGWLRVVPSHGGRLRGQAPTLMIGDEVWGWPDRDDLLESMQEALIKDPTSKLLLISTSAARLDSPLGRLRAQALAQPEVKRRGVVTEAKGDYVHWLEWSLEDSDSLDDMRRVKQANPARYISIPDLRRQRALVAEPQYAQYHCCKWGMGEGTWLPSGAWSSCAASYEIEEGEEVYAAVDVGGTRSRTACVFVTQDLRVGARVWSGEKAVLEVAEFCRVLASNYTVREIAYDPWRFRSEALRLESAGLTMTQFAQTASRLAPASETLYAAITEKRLRHPNHPDLNQHIANCIAVETPRGWKLAKATDAEPNDAAICLAMAVEAATAPPPTPTKVLGWL